MNDKWKIQHITIKNINQNKIEKTGKRAIFKEIIVRNFSDLSNMNSYINWS